MTNEIMLYAIGAIVLLVVLTIIGLMSRYRKCPSNKILIVFGKAGKDKEGNSVPAKIIHGGGTFVWPVIQDYAYMDVTPIQISTVAKDILSKQNINVTFPVNLTVGIDTSDQQMLQNAASRLLGMEEKNLIKLLTNNLLGGLRQVVANLTIEELKSDRDGLFASAAQAIQPSLNDLGFKIIDLNMEDLADDGNYLENLSQKAKAEAAAIAKADIAEKEKDGAIKEAVANKEKEITVGQTRKEQEITLANIEKEKAEQRAEIEKNQKTSVARSQAEQRAEVAKANTEAQKAEAIAIADAETATAAADATAKAAVAKSNADSAASQAAYNADSEAKKQEAEALKQTRIAKAKAAQETESQQAQQEKEARVAEFEADKQKRQALADQDAKVAQQKAVAAIATAEGEAEKTKQAAQKVAGMAKVDAEMSVAKQKQDQQLIVNEAEAKASAAKLNAEKVIPAEAAKKVAEIEASQKKVIQVIEAEAKAESKAKEAEGDAKAIREVAIANAEATELQGEADAKATKLKLDAQYSAEVAKAEGLSKAEFAGMNEFIDKLGDPTAAVNYFMREQTMAVGVAEAQSKVLHEVFGNVTVYGDSNTAGNMASSLLSLVPQIKQMGQAAGEGIQIIKDAWKGKNLPTAAPATEAPNAEEPTTVDSVGEQEFDAVK